MCCVDIWFDALFVININKTLGLMVVVTCLWRAVIYHPNEQVDVQNGFFLISAIVREWCRWDMETAKICLLVPIYIFGLWNFINSIVGPIACHIKKIFNILNRHRGEGERSSHVPDITRPGDIKTQLIANIVVLEVNVEFLTLQGEGPR